MKSTSEFFCCNVDQFTGPFPHTNLCSHPHVTPSTSPVVVVISENQKLLCFSSLGLEFLSRNHVSRYLPQKWVHILKCILKACVHFTFKTFFRTHVSFIKKLYIVGKIIFQKSETFNWLILL